MSRRSLRDTRRRDSTRPGRRDSRRAAPFRPATIVPAVIGLAAFVAGLGATPCDAREPSLTIRKSPFSSSTYRVWKEPRRGATPRTVERTIRRSPPVGAHSRGLEERGRAFTADPGPVKPRR